MVSLTLTHSLIICIVSDKFLFKLLKVMKKLIAIIYFTISFTSHCLEFHSFHLPPVTISKKGKASGTLPLMVKEICKEAKLDCDLTITPWKRVIKNIRVGKFKACFPMGYNKKRTEWLHYSLPLIGTEYGLFYILDYQKKITSISDLAGKSVVVHAKSNTLSQLQKLQKKHNIFKIIIERDVLVVLKKYSNKRYDKNTIIYGNKSIYLELFKELGISNIRYSLRDKAINYHVGFSKQSVSKGTVLLFNKAIKRLEKRGTLELIRLKFNFNSPVYSTFDKLN